MELPSVIDWLDFTCSPDPNRNVCGSSSKLGQDMLQPAMVALHFVDAIIEGRTSMREDRDPAHLCGRAYAMWEYDQERAMW
jgi:hypothetical protein